MTHKPIAQEVEEALDELDRMLAARKREEHVGKAVARWHRENARRLASIAWCETVAASNARTCDRLFGNTERTETEKIKRMDLQSLIAQAYAQDTSASTRYAIKQIDAESDAAIDRAIRAARARCADQSIGSIGEKIMDKVAGEGLVRAPKTFTDHHYGGFHYLSIRYAARLMGVRLAINHRVIPD